MSPNHTNSRFSLCGLQNRSNNETPKFSFIVYIFLIGLEPEQFHFYQLETNTESEIYGEEDEEKVRMRCGCSSYFQYLRS